MKKFIKLTAAAALLSATFLGATACTPDSDGQTADKLAALETQLAKLVEDNSKQNDDLNKQIEELMKKLENAEQSFSESISEISPLGAESYKKLKYIDANLSDRDCFNGEDFKATQAYIQEKALAAGYTESDVVYQAVPVTKYVKKTDAETAFTAAKSYDLDGKSYAKQGRKYVETDGGEYTKATVETENIIVTKQGANEKQIIVGMHYDGTGTGDNGSGVALGLSALESLKDVTTDLTIKFVFFTAEEYGCYGSSFYADNMTDEEVANTLYMINMDSLVCGDYTYLYGGVQDNGNKTVNKTEAYDNAMYIAKSLGLEFKSNPYTWDNLAPENYGGENPDYASPSTGDWSDHYGFKEKGITYLYFEATNWEIPDYTGYGESVLTGMIMNTDKDYLEYIETYYPGRPLAHLTKFATLLHALCVQSIESYTNITSSI